MPLSYTIYILDTSVIVKWFSSLDESEIEQARDIFLKLNQGIIGVVIPELLVYELTNALFKSKKLLPDEISSILGDFYTYPIKIEEINLKRIKSATELAYKCQITIYDAIFLALAKELSVPLVSANPRHHRSETDILVINLQDWEV